VGEDAFLEQAWAIHDERERMLFDSLRRMQRGLTVCVFDGPDRIQHMFWRHDVPDHPANRGRDTVRHKDVIDEMYGRMDELIGRVQKELRDEDFLFVISDHGFCDFSRGVNLNAWLRDNGYLKMNDAADSGEYFAGVDWSATKAYAFGLTGIYINQIGRESKGIVQAADAAALRQEIIGKLTGLKDPDRNCQAVHQVHDCHKEYSGPYVSNGPDVIVGYEKGYRASWENAVGRCDGPVFRDNDRPWSGDHCVDPALVPGMLLCNRSISPVNPTVISSNTAPSILDFAPTILRLFGVPLPSYFDGRPWEFEGQKPPAKVSQSPDASTNSSDSHASQQESSR
jgi:predicted AlkP superfamily phosphohydrolase/phosphomutase